MSRPPVVVATDPKGDFSHEEIIALRGPVNGILNTIPINGPQSAANGFSVNWKAPNGSSLISRYQRLTATINLVVTFTTAPTSIAPRQYPLHQLATTWMSWVNNQSIGGQVFGEVATQVMKYNSDQIERNTPSAPTLPDYFTEYSVGTAANSGYSITNVMGDSTQTLKGRAGWGGFKLSGLTSTSVNVTMTSDEPFIFGGSYALNKDAPAYVNVNTLQWAVNFSPNLNNLLSIVGGTGVSVAAANTGLFSSLNILVESYDPSPFMKLPSHAMYGVDRYDIQPSGTQYACAAGASVTMTSPVITCPAVPSRVYLFPKVPQALKSLTDCDFVGQITSLNLTLDSKPLLTTWDADGLGMLAMKNGFQGYFNDRDFVACQASSVASSVTTSRGVVGPGLCLVFGKDICLPDGVVSGTAGQHTIQAIVTVRNQSTTAYNASTYPLLLQTVLVYDEVLDVSNSMALVMPVNISPSESVKEGYRVPASEQAHGAAGGGLVYGRKTGFGGSHSGGGHSGGGHSGGTRTGGKGHKLK